MKARAKLYSGDGPFPSIIPGIEYDLILTSDGTGNFLAYHNGEYVATVPPEVFNIPDPAEVLQELHVQETDQKFKADAGKLRPSLLFDGMPNALMAVTAVLSCGAQKYEAHSWKGVDMARYEDAKERHNLARRAHETFDDESGLLHLAHEACNALFLLEDHIVKHAHPLEPNAFFKFNPPPTGHKQ